MRIAIFTETFIHKNTAAANQAAVLQKGLQQLGHKVLIVTGSTKATEIILDKGMLCCPASKSNNFYRQSANKIYAHMLDYYIGAFKPDVLHISVSYTHLDVYKRQASGCSGNKALISSSVFT